MASIFRRVVGSVLISPILGALAGAQAPAETFAVPAGGFAARDRLELPATAALSGIAYAPDGSLVVFVDGDLRLYGQGSPRLLTSLGAGVFGAFAVMSPGGEAVILCDGAPGNIYSVPLAGGERTPIDLLPFTYDIAFDASGRGFVSANDGGQEILLLDNDPATESRAVIVNIPGISGPVAMDPDGNLYYATADFSGDPVRQTLHRFAAAQIAAAIGGEPIDFAEGEELLEELPGFPTIKWFGGKLYASDFGFGGGLGRVVSIDVAGDLSVDDFATFPIDEGILSPTFLAVRPGSSPFLPGNGSPGGALLVAYSNFQTVSRLAEIHPELHFVRGRVNDDAVIDISDAVALLGFLFSGDAEPAVIEAADINADATLDISDSIYLLAYLFGGGPPPPPPFPDPGPAL